MINNDRKIEYLPIYDRLQYGAYQTAKKSSKTVVYDRAYLTRACNYIIERILLSDVQCHFLIFNSPRIDVSLYELIS